MDCIICSTTYLLDLIFGLPYTVKMKEIIVTDEFRQWYDDLSEDDFDAVNRVVALLEVKGVALPHPYSSAIKGCHYPLRELRIQSHGRPLRIFYAFDPTRNAVLLLGGDKTGHDRFYKEYVPRAEQLWVEYLRETGQLQ